MIVKSPPSYLIARGPMASVSGSSDPRTAVLLLVIDSQAKVVHWRFQLVAILCEPFVEVDWRQHLGGTRHKAELDGGQYDRAPLSASRLFLFFWSLDQAANYTISNHQCTHPIAPLFLSLLVVGTIMDGEALSSHRVRVALEAVKIELEDVRSALRGCQSLDKQVQSLRRDIEQAKLAWTEQGQTQESMKPLFAGARYLPLT